MPKQFLNNLLLYCQSFFYPMEVKLINLVSLESLKIKSRINQYSKKYNIMLAKLFQKQLNMSQMMVIA